MKLNLWFGDFLTLDRNEKKVPVAHDETGACYQFIDTHTHHSYHMTWTPLHFGEDRERNLHARRQHKVHVITSLSLFSRWHRISEHLSLEFVLSRVSDIVVMTSAQNHNNNKGSHVAYGIITSSRYHDETKCFSGAWLRPIQFKVYWSWSGKKRKGRNKEILRKS